jgi:two-component system, OmpR family, phosphate regulon response regulator OmpR
MKMEKKVLIIDDDIKLRDLLKEYLEGFGYQVSWLPEGSRTMDTIRDHPPDIVILDVMMPGEDGIEVLRKIRTKYLIPVIMLTARGEDSDRIIGLELGADDYLPKPFNPRELLARMKAVLRRADSSMVSEADDMISSGGLTLNRLRQRILYQDREADLSTTEFKLIEAFMERPGSVLSRDELMNLARGRDFMAFDRSIDVHVSRLRAKLEDLTGSRDWIKTHWGSGYLFTKVL